MIYLDNAATTYPKPEQVYLAMDKANRELAFNAGRGSYRRAREAAHLMDDTRRKLLGLVHGKGSGKVIFSPSVTIAINQILNGINFAQGDNVYVSPYEHNAVARTVHFLEQTKQVKVIEIPLDEKTWTIDLEKLQYMFSKDRPACVCCTHVSNATGYILPVSEIFEQAKKYKAVTLLDSAQSLGLIDVDASTMHADYIAFAGHKSLYGPFGVGGYIQIGEDILNTYLVGGTGSDSLNLEMPQALPDKYEPASHNIVAIAGLNAALDSLDVAEIKVHEKQLTEYLIAELQKIDGVVLYLPPEEARIGIVSLNIEGYRAEDIGMILDEDFDIAVRAGYHCAPYIHGHLKDKSFGGTVRVGIGRYNEKSDVENIVGAVAEVVGV